MSTATIRTFPKERCRSVARGSRARRVRQAAAAAGAAAAGSGCADGGAEASAAGPDVHRAHRRFARSRSARARRRHRAEAPLSGRRPRQAGPADVSDRSGARACAPVVRSCRSRSRQGAPGRSASSARSRAAAVRKERGEPEPSRRSGVGASKWRRRTCRGAVAAAHGAAGSGIHRRARADLGPDRAAKCCRKAAWSPPNRHPAC